MAKAKKIALRVLLGVLALPLVLIILFIVFEVFGAIVNHAAGNLQTKRFTGYAAEQGFEVLASDTFVGNSGNGNHVDLISSVYVTADRTTEEALALISSCDGSPAVWTPDEEDLSKAGVTPPEEGVLMLRLFNSAPFADNIEGH